MDKITEILQRYTNTTNGTADKLLGAASIIVDKNRVLYSGAAGVATFGPNATAWSLDSFSWIASMTKLLTSASAMQLVEKSALQLDQDLRPIVPELRNLQIVNGFDASNNPIMINNTRPITLKNILTHTLGLAYNFTSPTLPQYYEAIGSAPALWVKEFFLPPLVFAPGDGWVYGPATDWAGQALEHITGQSLGDYMQENLFTPLEMNSTGFWPTVPENAESRQVDWIIRESNGSLGLGPALFPPVPEIQSGGAGLFSTAQDYAAFLQAFLAGDVVSDATLDLMFAPQLDEAQTAQLMEAALDSPDGFSAEFPQGLPLNWGLGGIINMENVPGKRRKGSMAWSGLAGSRWWIDREAKIAGMLFTHVQPFGDAVVKALYDEIERVVYDVVGCQD